MDGRVCCILEQLLRWKPRMGFWLEGHSSEEEGLRKEAHLSEVEATV